MVGKNEMMPTALKKPPQSLNEVACFLVTTKIVAGFIFG